jgi:hypothetical protein
MRYATFATIALLASLISIAHALAGVQTLRDWSIASEGEKLQISRNFALVTKAVGGNATTIEIMACIDKIAEAPATWDQETRNVGSACVAMINSIPQR